MIYIYIHVHKLLFLLNKYYYFFPPDFFLLGIFIMSASNILLIQTSKTMAAPHTWRSLFLTIGILSSSIPRPLLSLQSSPLLVAQIGSVALLIPHVLVQGTNLKLWIFHLILRSIITRTTSTHRFYWRDLENRILQLY